jgi:hypothetical protein
MLGPDRAGGQAEMFGRALGQGQDIGLLLLPRRADADAEHGNAAIQAHEARNQPGLGAGAARGMHHMVDPQVHGGGLGHQLQRRADIAEGAHRVGAAARNDIGALAGLPQHLGQRLHLRLHVRAARAAGDDGAVQLVHHHIGGLGIGGVRVAGPVLEQDVAGEAQLGGRRRGLAGMVGLGGALGDDRVGALRTRLGHQVFELAGLVAAGGQAGAVVPLDPELRSAEVLRQVLHRLQWRREMAQADAGKASEIHRIDLAWTSSGGG